jgi:hypothetical protein
MWYYQAMPIATKELYLSWYDVERCLVYLMGKVTIDGATECFEWNGTRRNGYGVACFNGRVTGAHRLMLACTYRALPTCLETDHLCRNRACLSPSHLELVTHRVNAGRRSASQRLYCKYGHEFTPENTRRDKRGKRTCVTCGNEAMRQWRENHRDRMNEISRQSYARVGRKDRRKG